MKKERGRGGGRGRGKGEEVGKREKEGRRRGGRERMEEEEEERGEGVRGSRKTMKFHSPSVTSVKCTRQEAKAAEELTMFWRKPLKHWKRSATDHTP